MGGSNGNDPRVLADVAPEHVEFLRERFIAVREALVDDLARCEGRLGDPEGTATRS